MYYETFNDYLIDNRNDIFKRIKYMSVEELQSEVLKAYDFVAIEAIKQFESYKLLKAAVIDRYGQKNFDEMTKTGTADFLELLKATDKYTQDVKLSEKVGYSAENLIKRKDKNNFD